MRPIALMFAALTLLAGAGQVQAEGFDSRGFMGDGPSFFGSSGIGSSSGAAPSVSSSTS